jgi:hypothetical protein
MLLKVISVMPEDLDGVVSSAARGLPGPVPKPTAVHAVLQRAATNLPQSEDSVSRLRVPDLPQSDDSVRSLIFGLICVLVGCVKNVVVRVCRLLGRRFSF